MFADYPQAEQLPALRQLWQEAFGDDDAFLDKFFTTAYSPNRCRVVTLEGQAAAALYWLDCFWEDRKLAYIYAVATAEAFRGQGVCRQLMDRCHQVLSQQGYFGSVLVPAEPGLSALYEKFGYRHFGGMKPLELTAAATAAPIREITPAEYARQKAALLPPGSVTQDGAILDFLATYARFYAGDGILFSLAAEGETGWFQEYFGPVSSAGEALCALGLSRGRLRQQDGVTPFSMFRPLRPCDSLPTYLGIPLD